MLSDKMIVCVNVVKNVLFPYPSIKEQYEIAEYLKTVFKKINLVTEQFEDSIKKLKELKTSIINQAVTGKIKVS